MVINLREIHEDDLVMIMNWRMLPKVTKYMYTDPDLSIEKQLDWYNSILQNKKREKYWIIQLESGVDVGLISINNIDYVNKQASWAYYLGEIEARGQGLARILECNIYDYVFDQLNLNKLWCEIFEFNETVINIHKKFGAIEEGKFKDHIFKEGKYLDVIRMATFKEKWLILREQTNYKKITIEDY